MSKCNKCKYEYSSKLDEPCKYCREKYGIVTLGYQMSEDKFVPKEEQPTTEHNGCDGCVSENGMEEVYDNFDGCMSAMNMFKEGVNLLTGLINEHFEEKQETNYEYYKDEIIEKSNLFFALVDGKPHQCSDVSCCDCGFSTGHGCTEKVKEWLKQPHIKPTYKLTQFEYDLLQHFSVDFKFKEMGLLKEMKEKGHFKNINGDELIKDILANCEVIK